MPADHTENIHSPRPEILLVTPSYRDSLRLAAFAPELAHALAACDLGVQWVVADDGSGPAEVSRLERLVQGLREIFPAISIFAHPPHLGKGGVLRTAFARETTARWLAFVDADGSIDAASTLHLLQQTAAAPPATALLGSRRPDPNTRVVQSWRRRLTHRVFAAISRFLLGLPVFDTQCGLKAIQRDDFIRILPHLREDGFVFDGEWLLALHRAGVHLREIPVNWAERGGGSVRPAREASRMLAGLWRVRRRFRTLPC